VALPVSQQTVIFEETFENYTDWSREGLWATGIPQGMGGQEQQYPVPDPTEGCSGASVLGYNLSGDYENNLPARHAISPVIDCSGMTRTRLRFCRWLGVEQPGYDKASVSISTNGNDWTTLWQNPAIIADLEWMDVEYDISEFADNEPTVYLRWTMGPTDGGLRFCGWNIDDVRLVSLECRSWSCGDSDMSGELDIDDVVYLIAYIFSGGPAPDPLAAGDADCSGAIDIDDVVYVIAYIFSGGNPPCDTNGDQVPDC
jgi:hypothetical protein